MKARSLIKAAVFSATLALQVAAQAAGPLLSGALRDWSGDYVTSLMCFATLAATAVVAAFLVRAPSAG